MKRKILSILFCALCLQGFSQVILVNGKAIVSLTDQSGKRIYTNEINDIGRIDVSKLAAGLYYIKNHITGITQKIIVTK